MAIYAVEISIINKKYKHIPLEKNISRTVESQKKEETYRNRSGRRAAKWYEVNFITNRLRKDFADVTCKDFMNRPTDRRRGGYSESQTNTPSPRRLHLYEYINKYI